VSVLLENAISFSSGGLNAVFDGTGLKGMSLRGLEKCGAGKIRGENPRESFPQTRGRGNRTRYTQANATERAGEFPGLVKAGKILPVFWGIVQR